MRFFNYRVILLFILILLSPKIAWAETVRVTLVADEITYDYGSKQVEAKGNVRISYKKTEVESDYAIIDHEQNIFLATGKVKVIKDGDEFNGDRFLYYLETQQGWIFPVVTEVTDDEIEGKLFYTAGDAFIKSEDILFKKAVVTGCDLENPHYRFSAKKVEYIPGDKIRMSHVLYWEHRVPIFYFPILVISLEEDSNNFGWQLGWNNYDGWWLLAWYTYYFRNDDSLMVRNKTTEHGVDRWELYYTNEISSTRKFTSAFELADNDKIGNPNDDFRAGFKFEDRTHPKLNYETTLDNWKRYDISGDTYFENEYNFTLRGQSPYPFLALDYDTIGIEGIRQINLQESWRYNFGSSSSFSLRGRWFYDELRNVPGTDDPVRNYTYNSSFDKRWDRSQLSIKAQESKTIGYSSENVIPDILYTIPQWELPLLGKIKIVTQYTDKEKYNGNTDQMTEGQRLALNLEKTDKLWGKGSISLDNKAYFRFREYLVDDYLSELNAFTEELNLTNKFTDKLSTTVALSYTGVQGENNIFFDENIRPGAEVWNSWNWRGQHLGMNLKTGYNVETEYYYPLNFDTSWTSDKSRVSLHTIYHWDNGPEYQVGLGQTTLEAALNPKQDWHFRLSMTYDFWNQTWGSKMANLQLTQKVSKNWKVGLRATYDMFVEDFSIANASLIYDWHCRELEFYYDWVEREYWLQLTFKAFPMFKLNTGVDPWEYLNYE